MSPICQDPEEDPNSDPQMRGNRLRCSGITQGTTKTEACSELETAETPTSVSTVKFILHHNGLTGFGPSETFYGQVT